MRLTHGMTAWALLALALCAGAEAEAGSGGPPPRPVPADLLPSRWQGADVSPPPFLIPPGVGPGSVHVAGVNTQHLDAVTGGAWRVLVVRPRLPANCTQARFTGATREAWYQILNDTSALLSACSAGQVSIDSDWVRVVDVNIPCAAADNVTCPPPAAAAFNKWRASTEARLAKLGVNVDDYGSVVFDFPYSRCFQAAGWSYIGWNRLMLSDMARSESPVALLAHEMGHTFGLGHAHTLTPAAFKPGGKPAENGDDWSSVLADSNGPSCYNLPQNAYMNINAPTELSLESLPAGQVLQFTMRPYWSARDEGLVIDPSGWRPAYSDWRVWVSYKSLDGFPVEVAGGRANPTVFNRMVMVHVTSSRLVEAGEFAPKTFRAAALLGGAAFSLSQLGLLFKVVEAGATAKVLICRREKKGQCSFRTTLPATVQQARIYQPSIYWAESDWCLSACTRPDCRLPRRSKAFPKAAINVLFAPQCPSLGTLWELRTFSNGFVQIRNRYKKRCLAVQRVPQLEPFEDWYAPRLILAQCARDFTFPTLDGSPQLFSWRRDSAVDPSDVRLRWGPSGCVDGCDSAGCRRDAYLNPNRTAAAAYMGYCWGGDMGWAQYWQTMEVRTL